MITASRLRTNDGSPTAPAASQIPTASITTRPARIKTTTARCPKADADALAALTAIGGYAPGQRRLHAGQAQRRVRRAQTRRRCLCTGGGRLADRARQQRGRAMDVPQRPARSQAAGPRAIRRRQRRGAGPRIDQKIRTRQALGKSESRRSNGEIKLLRPVYDRRTKQRRVRKGAPFLFHPQPIKEAI